MVELAAPYPNCIAGAATDEDLGRVLDWDRSQQKDCVISYTVEATAVRKDPRADAKDVRKLTYGDKVPVQGRANGFVKVGEDE